MMEIVVMVGRSASRVDMTLHFSGMHIFFFFIHINASYFIFFRFNHYSYFVVYYNDYYYDNKRPGEHNRRNYK